jgi:aspartyl-tRNA synthetase
MTFLVLRQGMATVQCVIVADAGAGVTQRMVRFAAALSNESCVQVEGVVSLPKHKPLATTQQVRSLCPLLTNLSAQNKIHNSHFSKLFGKSNDFEFESNLYKKHL